MKACESCSRVEIGKNHKKQSVFIRAIATPLVYVPLLMVPFVVLSAYTCYFHLRLSGGKNIKKWSDFIPDRATHRYELKSQVAMDPTFKLSAAQSKLYWIFNCTWYCPFSVALFEWHAYLVKVIENWWCPFTHNRKDEHYQDAAIDKSFWHIYPEEASKLHEDDLNNPIWNEDMAAKNSDKDK
ncbi:MAG: hypothetical protein GQ569_11715 [Methylococcaceae bacterium]|nr:hypothetical protein [Methylococcaceae bacterium]